MPPYERPSSFRNLDRLKQTYFKLLDLLQDPKYPEGLRVILLLWMFLDDRRVYKLDPSRPETLDQLIEDNFDDISSPEEYRSRAESVCRYYLSACELDAPENAFTRPFHPIGGHTLAAHVEETSSSEFDAEGNIKPDKLFQVFITSLQRSKRTLLTGFALQRDAMRALYMLVANPEYMQMLLEKLFAHRVISAGYAVEDKNNKLISPLKLAEPVLGLLYYFDAYDNESPTLPIYATRRPAGFSDVGFMISLQDDGKILLDSLFPTPAWKEGVALVDRIAEYGAKRVKLTSE